jgi:hypothetical protein
MYKVDDCFYLIITIIVLQMNKWVCKCCQTNRSLNQVQQTCQSCLDKFASENIKRCNTCKQTHSWNQFHKSKTALFGISNKCKLCISKYDQERMQKKDNFIVRILANCTSNIKCRNKKGRNLEMTWTLDEM